MKIRSKRSILPIAAILLVFIAIAIANVIPEAAKDPNKIAIAIPEGLASSDIARVIKQKIPSFDSRQFAVLAKPYEGYLLPDIYSFAATTTPQEAIDMMRENFHERTKWLRFLSDMNNKSFKDVVIVASLVEEESSSIMDRRIISGIIWKRLSMGMPLQLDAPFFYLIGKASHELTYGDLAMDSPYNLYKNKGLPPAPIDNPSLNSIAAAINPIKTKYLYFLSDSNGIMHFSETFEGHMVKRGEHIE